MYLCVCVCVSMALSLSLSLCVCVCVCVFRWISSVTFDIIGATRQAHTQRERERERHTHTHTHLHCRCVWASGATRCGLRGRLCPDGSPPTGTSRSTSSSASLSTTPRAQRQRQGEGEREGGACVCVSVCRCGNRHPRLSLRCHQGLYHHFNRPGKGKVRGEAGHSLPPSLPPSPTHNNSL